MTAVVVLLAQGALVGMCIGVYARVARKERAVRALFEEHRRYLSGLNDTLAAIRDLDS